MRDSGHICDMTASAKGDVTESYKRVGLHSEVPEKSQILMASDRCTEILR